MSISLVCDFLVFHGDSQESQKLEMQTHSFSKGGTWEYLRPVGWNTARSVQIKMSCFLWFLWSFLLQVVFGFVELWNKNFLPSKSKTHKGTASTFAVLLVKDSKSPTKVRKELKNDSDDANKTQHLRRFVCRLEFWAFSKKRKFTFRANFDTRQWWSGNRWEEPNYSGMWRATGGSCTRCPTQTTVKGYFPAVSA